MKLIEGEPNKDRLNFDEPRSPSLDYKCPSILKGPARKEWFRLIEELKPTGMLTRLDVTALTQLCAAFGEWMEAKKQIGKTGLLIKAGNGTPIPNPLISIARNAEGTVIRIMTEFGMTPSSRQRIRVNPPHEESDEMERLLTAVK
jgi:P27 family predicted phage terminase small subunit